MWSSDRPAQEEELGLCRSSMAAASVGAHLRRGTRGTGPLEAGVHGAAPAALAPGSRAPAVCASLLGRQPDPEGPALTAAALPETRAWGCAGPTQGGGLSKDQSGERLWGSEG